MIAISDQPSIVKIAYSNIYWWCHKSWREKKLSFFPPFCLIHENCFSSSSACASRNGRRRDKSKYLAIAAKILIQRVFIFFLDFYFLVNGLQLRSWSLWLRKQLKMSRIRNCAVDSNEKDGSFHNLSWARRKKELLKKFLPTNSSWRKPQKPQNKWNFTLLTVVIASENTNFKFRITRWTLNSLSSSFRALVIVLFSFDVIANWLEISSPPS